MTSVNQGSVGASEVEELPDACLQNHLSVTPADFVVVDREFAVGEAADVEGGGEVLRCWPAGEIYRNAEDGLGHGELRSPDYTWGGI